MVRILSIASIVMVVLYCLATVLTDMATKSLINAYEEMYHLSNYTIAFGDASAYLTEEVRAYAASGNTVHYDNYWNEVNNLKNREKNVSLARANGIEEDESKVFDDIAKVSEEQANAIQQINLGIDQIASVVQTNSATAEESATASEELSSQANVVKKMVAEFRLKNEGSAAAAEELTFVAPVTEEEVTPFAAPTGDKY